MRVLRDSVAVLAFAGLGATGVGCGQGSDLAQVDQWEWLPGGRSTNATLGGVHAFVQPSTNLDPSRRNAHFVGDSLFNQNWVQAPSSTVGRDGLGPTFNARACATCHVRDGRGAPPTSTSESAALLMRISLPGSDDNGGPVEVPGYGLQIQPQALGPAEAEALVRITYESIEGTYADGTPYTLEKPIYQLDAPAFGAFPSNMRVSPRIAPVMIGLGLLESIAASDIEALADPEDEDGDGIAGTVQRVWDIKHGEMRLGRFGWKAEQPSLAQQTGAAFLGDIGITSPMFPDSNCPDPQQACASMVTGSETGDDREPEITERSFDDVVLYTQTLAPPYRPNWEDPEVLRGKRLFHKAACASCHVPSFTTSSDGVLPELSDELIFPYTDLLLHDMGEGLADGRPVFEASGQAWRTPPLWGIGRVEEVNGHERFLHDGRARGLAEAILWHGGEAEQSKQAFVAMDSEQREALIAFLESL